MKSRLHFTFTSVVFVAVAPRLSALQLISAINDFVTFLTIRVPEVL
jgi:hypothetical protein